MALQDWKQGEVMLCVPNPNVPYYMPCRIGAPALLCGGLAIHKACNGWRDGVFTFHNRAWAVSHAKTGRRLPGYPKTRKVAIAFAERLLAVRSWTGKVSSTKPRPKGLWDTVRGIAKEMGAW